MSLLTKFDQGAVRVGFILEQVCMFFFVLFRSVSFLQKQINPQSIAKLQRRMHYVL